MADRNILLLIDDSESRENLRSIFEDQYQLLEAQAGEQALILLEQNMERIAAVLLNEGAVQGECQVLQTMKTAGITDLLPVIAVVDWGQEDREARMLAKGAADVLTRPFSRHAARKRVQNLIALFHGASALTVPPEPARRKRINLLPDDMAQKLLNALDSVDSEELDQSIYRIIMEQSGDVAFLWDMETDVLRCSSKWRARFGYSPICREASANLVMISHFHPDDLERIQDKINSLRNGTEYGEVIVRIVDSEGRYIWNRIRATAQWDENGELKKIIGVVADVDSDHRASRELMKKAERDALTGLLNKDTARTQVEHYLSQTESDHHAALLIVDLDDFKEINDHFGHLFGDAVLNRVASSIRGLFRGKDILARIGGDEFMVFMRDIPDGDLVERRCIMLLDTLRELFAEQVPGCQFSCSVGFALMPDHGVTYQTLFQRADRALYQAKGSGKNTYRCYAAPDSTAPYPTKVSQRIDSDAQARINIGGYANFALETLRETGDEQGTIRMLLSLIGAQMQVDRLYLYEYVEKTQACVNRFEWCMEGHTPLGVHYPVFPYERILQFNNAFDEQGILYASGVLDLPDGLRDVTERDGSTAILIRSIRDKGAFRGFIGADMCGRNRLWTQDEIEILTFLSHLASLWLPRINWEEE